MKTFLRENPTIAFGLGLPIVLVVVFLALSGLPNLLVPAPKYDVLYATGYFSNPNGVRVAVVDGKVQVIYQDSLHASVKPQIWRYNSQTGAVQEIFYLLPSKPAVPEEKVASQKELSKPTLVEVPDLDDVTIDSSSVAPDGYEFSVNNQGYTSNLLSLFFFPRYHDIAVLKKNGRSIRLPNAVSINGTHFVGWVIP